MLLFSTGLRPVLKPIRTLSHIFLAHSSLPHVSSACYVTPGPLPGHANCQVLTHAFLLSPPLLSYATPYQTVSLHWSHSSHQKLSSVPCHHALPGRGVPAKLDELPCQGLERQAGAAFSRTSGAIPGSLALEWITGLGERKKAGRSTVGTQAE